MFLIDFLQKQSKSVCNSLQIQKKFLLIWQKIIRRFKKGITPLLCALTLFNLCCISVNAQSYICKIPYVKPPVPDVGGYVLLNGTNQYGSFNTMYYFAFYPYSHDWEFSANDSNELISSVYLEFYNSSVSVTDSSISFRISATSNYEIPLSGYLVFYRVYHDGEIRVIDSAYHSLSQPYVWTTSTLGTINAVNIVGNFSSISNNLSTYNSLDVVWGDDLAFYNLLESNSQIINNIYSRLGSIGSDVSSIKNALIQGDSNGSIQDVSSSGITNVSNKEQELLDKNDSVSSDINNLQVDINPNAAAVTWNLVNSAVMSHEKVFTMFISILTLGIVALVLNR